MRSSEIPVYSCQHTDSDLSLSTHTQKKPKDQFSTYFSRTAGLCTNLGGIILSSVLKICVYGKRAKCNGSYESFFHPFSQEFIEVLKRSSYNVFHSRPKGKMGFFKIRFKLDIELLPFNDFCTIPRTLWESNRIWGVLLTLSFYPNT